MHRSRPFCIAALVCGIVLLTGCAHRSNNLSVQMPLSVEGLSTPTFVASVDAVAVPPIGWKPDPLRKSSKHTHEVWVAPSQTTCYGVMHFSLPFPVGADLAVWGFMREMQRKQGEAIMIWKHEDPRLPGMRFMAEGGKYCVRVNLITKGWEGWAFYAGTLRDKPVNPAELDLAERAREYTAPGSPKRPKNPS